MTRGIVIALVIVLAVAGCELQQLSERLDASTMIDASRGGDAGARSDLALADLADDAAAADSVVKRPAGDAQPVTKSCTGAPLSADVDTAGEPGLHTSIAVDGKGAIHVAHFADADDDARYSVRDDQGAWASEAVRTAGAVGGFNALGVGPAGRVHLVFYDYGANALRYAWRDAVGWMPAQVVAKPAGISGHVGAGSDLAVDSSGTVHVVTYDGERDRLIYLRRTAGGWQPPLELEPAAGEFGPKAGVAVGADGTAHFSFCDGAGRLKYRSAQNPSTQNPSTQNPSTGGASLSPSAVVLDEGLGEQCNSDVALDAAGDVQISYHDHATRRLRFVGQQGGVFGQPITLDASAAVGLHNALVAGPEGDLWVAYYDGTHLDLRVIRRQAGSWGAPTIVDSAGYVGRYVSAALAPDGALHIAHWNGTRRALRHTRVCPGS